MVDDNKLKTMLTEMMECFHDFCVENDLCYYVAGGTMLGAMRHQGFIPWDDDIDVIMPRKDYNRLAVLLKNKKINDRYILETPETEAKDYYYPFSKIYDTKTTLIENTKYKPKRGIYLDIFPLDGFGQTAEESRKNYKKIEITFNLLLSKVGGVRKGRKFYKNLAVCLFRIIPLNPKKILNKLVEQCSLYDFNECAYGGNPVGAWRFKEIMPTNIMGKPKLYKFENIYVFGAENADAYLTHLYGDWRQLPPEEKRISHHDYIKCDLNKSYLD